MTVITRAEISAAISESTTASSPASASFAIPEFGENIPAFHGLMGRSPVMRHLFSQFDRVAAHLTVATLEGEDGTGRTLAAQALHAAGPGATQIFLPCAASKFFHDSTIDPADSVQGWSAEIVRQSRRGTLFLDRIHQLSERQQGHLADFLRWFDDCQGRRTATGADSRFAGDLPAQILFSSSLPLRQREGSAFRTDVASWLSAVCFRVPPLRERREDIPLLAQIFIQRFSRTFGKPVRGLGPGTIAPLLRYAWPGNVRELEQVITAAALDTQSQWIRPIDLPPLPPGNRPTTIVASSVTPTDADRTTEHDVNLDRMIRRHVWRVLEGTRGNKVRAAQLLGISRSTLYRILAAKEAIMAPSVATP